jgi:hypothetical protein
VQEAVREFDCRRCGKRVCVCRRCDRGQVYCAADCASQSRRACLRAARERYQKSRRGAHLHADRQRRYRARRALRRRTIGKMVTDQGSVAARVMGTVVCSGIAANPERTDDPACAPPGTVSRRCDFCGATVPDPDPRLSGGGSGAASADPALRAAAQAPTACVFRARKASDSRHAGPWFHTMSVQCS